MGYALKGEFFEVCDCEAVCSCWAEIDPVMGGCTGLFAWFITSGTVGAVNVAGCNAMLLFNGTRCDKARHLLLLVHGGTPQQRDAVRVAITTGPWSDVVRLDTGVVMPALVPATITKTPIAGQANKVGLSALAVDCVAEAFCEIQSYELHGPAGSLIRRSTGAGSPQSIKVGKVYTDASGTGLNLLAVDKTLPAPYTFDVDITDISAVRGKFSYTSV
jgi:hypothetical protein